MPAAPYPDPLGLVAAAVLETDRPGGRGRSLLGAAAEFERALILERQREGIAIAKAGKYKGRRRILNPAQILELRGCVAGGERKTALAREFGVSRETLYCYHRAR
jgi:DNA invertase Pin-like site-specific DNA recombinase